MATGWLQAAEWPLEGSTTIHLEQRFPNPPCGSKGHRLLGGELQLLGFGNLGGSQAVPVASLAPPPPPPLGIS